MNESHNKKQTGVKRKTKAKNKEAALKKSATNKKEKSHKANLKKTEKHALHDKKQKKSSTKKSTKEETKDSKIPKRAWPAFFFFQKEKRLTLKKDNPTLSQKELVSKLGEMWRGLSDVQKKPYIDQERKDKARYMKEKEEFSKTAKTLPGNKSKSKKNNLKGTQQKPKRAWPPFFFFQEARREGLKEENPTLNHKEIVSKLGEEWRTLTDEQKRPYVNKSAEDQKRYDKEK